MAVEPSGGTVWWLPCGASDVEHLTGEVLSYEHDGTLSLARPLPGVVDVGLDGDPTDEGTPAST